MWGFSLDPAFLLLVPVHRDGQRLRAASPAKRGGGCLHLCRHWPRSDTSVSLDHPSDLLQSRQRGATLRIPTEIRADFKSSSERTALLPRLDSVVLPSVISYLAPAPSSETGTTVPNLTAEAFITCSSEAFIFVYHAISTSPWWFFVPAATVASHFSLLVEQSQST